MATGDFLPTREFDLVAWSAVFSAQISATPAAFGVSIVQADSYAALHDAYSAAYFTSQWPSTRTSVSIVEKNTARDALIADARQLSRQIQGTAGITGAQKVSLGLALPNPDPPPVRRPRVSPLLTITSTIGRTVTIRLSDAKHITRRGRPRGVAFATVLTYVGAQPPSDISAWTFAGNTTRVNAYRISFPSIVPEGSKVWITAMWYNTRAQGGPAAAAQTTHIAGGVAMPLAIAA